MVLTKSKTALRKVVKITHKVIQELKFQLHPSKTYIGKICNGFNFLAYYMDHQKILPSTETIRCFHERALALYETSQGKRDRPNPYKRMVDRDISEYQVNEPAPIDAYFQHILAHLLSLAGASSDTVASLRRHFGQWTCWLKLGLSTINDFETCVTNHLPSISSCWMKGAKVFSLGKCL